MEYVQRIPDLIHKHGGRYIVQGVEPTVVQGDGGIPQRSVVLEFPDKKSAVSFLEERAATDLHEIWEQSTNSRILMLEGVAE